MLPFTRAWAGASAVGPALPGRARAWPGVWGLLRLAPGGGGGPQRSVSPSVGGLGATGRRAGERRAADGGPRTGDPGLRAGGPADAAHPLLRPRRTRRPVFVPACASARRPFDDRGRKPHSAPQVVSSFQGSRNQAQLSICVVPYSSSFSNQHISFPNLRLPRQMYPHSS